MARVDRERVFRPQMVLGNARENRLLQAAQSVFLDAANPQRIMIFPVGMLRQIALVEQHELDSIRRVPLEARRLRRIPIENVQKKIGRGERLFGARDSLAFQFILRNRAGRPCRAIESECRAD